MKKEYKELLLKDLCARLPFGICANLPNHHLVSHKYTIYDINIQDGWTTGILDCAGRIRIYSAKVEDIKPYLRPMSSMTEEERLELSRLSDDKFKFYLYTTKSEIICYEKYNYLEGLKVLDWLNAHHFDYRGLTELGLALPAPEGMYNIK